MKNILVILDGIVSKKLLSRMVDSNVVNNMYDVIYMDSSILCDEKPENFTFYKFDPTSFSKLYTVLTKVNHTEVLIVLNSKEEIQSVIKNIRNYKKNLQITIYNNWEITLSEDPYVNNYNGIEVLANGLLEKLPNVPIVAQNIGLRQGEIMELRIPFGSSYAYRYVGSIEQKDWKIFGLYRNDKLLSIKPSLVLKPNDIILMIGNPNVLMQVYATITKTQGQFPRPFGENLYLYFDLYLQTDKEVINCAKETRDLHRKLKNDKLVIKITRPTNNQVLKQIYAIFKKLDNVEIELDYHNIGFNKILCDDVKRFNIGMIILSHTLLRNKESTKKILDLKLPLYKLGIEPISRVNQSVVLLNQSTHYEQISPLVFDISNQLKTKVTVFDSDPIEDKTQDVIIEHFENLGKIFNTPIKTIRNNKNPIKELQQLQNIIQILPLRDDMFETRLFKFFNTDSDLLSYDINKFNQIFIPIIEE
ncbi:MAG: potassium transporter TrkA [Campylobacterota bacterium]|nr:potassium transporter TrkA [Campylobacterota bacterium]